MYTKLGTYHAMFAGSRMGQKRLSSFSSHLVVPCKYSYVTWMSSVVLYLPWANFEEVCQMLGLIVEAVHIMLLSVPSTTVLPLSCCWLKCASSYTGLGIKDNGDWQSRTLSILITFVGELTVVSRQRVLHYLSLAFTIMWKHCLRLCGNISLYPRFVLTVIMSSL
jgi:hypothetical protein